MVPSETPEVSCGRGGCVNETLNDPELNHPTGGFLGPLGSFPHSLSHQQVLWAVDFHAVFPQGERRKGRAGLRVCAHGPTDSCCDLDRTPATLGGPG